jgi:lysophospholipase L1-like esterase
MKNIVRFLFSIVVVLFSIYVGGNSALYGDNTAIIPVPKLENDFYNWYKRHDAVKAQIKKMKNVDIVFIGDSITHMFGGEPKGKIVRGAEVWKEYYGNRKVINMGFGWDRTQNVLWRLEHGEWDGISPKVAVVLIGTNNLKGTNHAPQNTPTEIVEGITAVCEAIHKKSPKTQIILLSVLPRAEKSYVPMIKDINKRVALLGKKSYITILDLTKKFKGKNGFPKKELMTDKVHPNAAGYRVWAKTMEPLLSKLLGDKQRTPNK